MYTPMPVFTPVSVISVHVWLYGFAAWTFEKVFQYVVYVNVSPLLAVVDPVALTPTIFTVTPRGQSGRRRVRPRT